MKQESGQELAMRSTGKENSTHVHCCHSQSSMPSFCRKWILTNRRRAAIMVQIGIHRHCVTMITVLRMSWGCAKSGVTPGGGGIPGSEPDIGGCCDLETMATGFTDGSILRKKRKLAIKVPLSPHQPCPCLLPLMGISCLTKPLRHFF